MWSFEGKKLELVNWMNLLFLGTNKVKLRCCANWFASKLFVVLFLSICFFFWLWQQVSASALYSIKWTRFYCHCDSFQFEKRKKNHFANWLQSSRQLLSKLGKVYKKEPTRACTRIHWVMRKVYRLILKCWQYWRIGQQCTTQKMSKNPIDFVWHGQTYMFRWRNVLCVCVCVAI